jgi:glycosyltransferase involved in cell wall biosynthesis
MDPLRVVVAVLSYRRPTELAAALPLILEQAEQLSREPAENIVVEVLVIDNDPSLSARPVVEPFGSRPVRYVAEPIPGISAGRNRALDESTDRELLVYIDDDEKPTADWLAPLVHTWRQTGAAAVMGRVVSVFDEEPDPWVRAGSFFTRRSMPTGTPIRVAAAGNLLLDLRQARALGVRFHGDFGLTGGEDTLFSRQLTAAGGLIVWCDESVATDQVPAERTTRRWVLRRAWSHGNTMSLVDLRLAAGPLEKAFMRLRGVGRGIVRMLGGTARFALGLATRSVRHQARGLRTAYRGAGMFCGALGFAYREYARK